MFNKKETVFKNRIRRKKWKKNPNQTKPLHVIFILSRTITVSVAKEKQTVMQSLGSALYDTILQLDRSQFCAAFQPWVLQEPIANTPWPSSHFFLLSSTTILAQWMHVAENMESWCSFILKMWTCSHFCVTLCLYSVTETGNQWVWLHLLKCQDISHFLSQCAVALW